MIHIPCLIKCVTGQILSSPGELTSIGLLDCILGASGPLDAPKVVPTGGLKNVYFDDGLHDLAMSFNMREVQV